MATGKKRKDEPKASSTPPLEMEGVDPEDALRAFMQLDPEKVKRAEKGTKKKE